jgi:ureidoacrylate peracid hydrolase
LYGLLVVDMQNDFVDKDGWYSTHGVQVDVLRGIIPNLNSLISSFRENSLPIIFTRFCFKEDLSDSGDYSIKRPLIKAGGLRSGSWGADVIKELDHRATDYYVDKTRHSAFDKTQLDDLLERLDIDKLVITGVGTEACVLTTLFDTLFRKQDIYLVEECTTTWGGGLRDAGLEISKRLCTVVTLKDTINSLPNESRIPGSKLMEGVPNEEVPQT